MKPPTPNRATRRALDKGVLCLSRGTRVPPAVLSTLRIQVPGALNVLAGRRGMRITPEGFVLPAARSAGIDTLAIEPATAL